MTKDKATTLVHSGIGIITDENELPIKINFQWEQSASGNLITTTVETLADSRFFNRIFRSQKRIDLQGLLLCGKKFHAPYLTIGGVKSTYEEDKCIYQITLVPKNVFSCGEEIANCMKAQYELRGSMESINSFEIDSYKISIVERYFSESDLRLYSRRHLQYLTSSALEVVGLEKPLSEYEKISENMLNLISIAQGYSIVCDQRTYINESNEVYESYGANTGDGIGPGLIIPKSLVSKFLCDCYPEYEKLPEKIRSAISISTKYINLSTYGYLDIQLLQIFQAWELLANAFCKEYGAMDADARESDNVDGERQALINSLRECYEKWAFKNTEYAKKDNFLSKIIGPIKHNANGNIIGKFVEGTGLDLSHLSLDMRDFRNHTNRVRHVGSLKNNKEYGDIDRLLENARFGIRLQILRILNYGGMVVTRNEMGAQCEHSISKYFNGSMNAGT